MAKKRNLTEKTRALILAAAAKGCTNAEIRRAVKASNTVFARWIQENPELEDEIQDARLPSIESVEARLYQRAQGYEYDEVSVEKEAATDAEGNELAVFRTKTKTVHKQIAPDVSAIKFILTNRRGDRWKPENKLEVEGGGKAVYLVKLPE